MQGDDLKAFRSRLACGARMIAPRRRDDPSRKLMREAAMRCVRLIMLLLGVSLAAPALAAEKYPSRPVHWLVGFAAGGPTDIVARIMAEWLSDPLGQQFVIENRTGSGGMIAASALINSAPDGYTIMFDAPNNAIGTSLYKNLPFVFLRDTVPVAGMVRLTNILVVPPDRQ